MVNMFLSPEDFFVSRHVRPLLPQANFIGCLYASETSCVPFRKRSQLYFLNMLMISQSLWLWHTAETWQPMVNIQTAVVWNILNLSALCCSDHAGPEVIFHSWMCVSGGKQRWVYLFKCKYIISPLVYGIHYRFLVVRVLTWPANQLHCFIEKQRHRTPAESSVPVPHNPKPIYRNRPDLVLPGSCWV